MSDHAQIYPSVGESRHRPYLYLQLTFVDIDAGLREIVASKTGPAGACVAAYGINALLIAATSILELPAFVNVDAAAIPHESGAAHTLFVH